MNAAPDHTPAFTEDAVSQLPAMHLLQKLGWELLTPAEALKLRGGRRSHVLLREVLERQLAAINSFDYRGAHHAFDRSAVAEGIRALTNLSDDGLVRTNENVWELLRFGKSLPQTVDGDTKSYTLQYIDWEHPERNTYQVTDEYSVASFGSTQTRRPDLVLFVNGIPFVVIECKRPGNVGGDDPLEQAITQQLRNQREDEIPRLFHFAQVLMALAVNQAEYAPTGAPATFWQGWRELRPADEALDALLRTPLTKEEAQRTFAADSLRSAGRTGKHAQAWLEEVIASGRTPSVQDRLLYALARPARLLALASRYTVFEGGFRKLARYQQYFAVEDILERVNAIGPDGRRRGGLVWHTQGSGKSLTMVMLAQALLEKFAARSPKIVLVTDRVDLDDQIYGTFHAAGVETQQASTGRHLLDLLSSDRTEVVTTLLQKFEAAMNALRAAGDAEAAFASPDIFVLADEGHRSYGGQFHAALRRVLPNACYIGFTGTPVFNSEKPTVQQFGGLIGLPYTIDQAVKDKAVVPLLYEGRYVQQHVDQLPIDEWFKRYTAGLTEAQRVDLKRKYSSADQLNQVEQRVRAIAWDISTHFQTHYQGTGFKGQLVAPSKATALLYKRFLDEFALVTNEVLISGPGSDEGKPDTDEGQGRGTQAVVAFWAEMMKRFGTESRYQKDLTTRFKSADEPEIIVVVDKLLTGFDAPRNAVMYLTRSLKDHKLLQAIARVNRVCEGKDYGLIVDYYGILDKLGEALEEYTTDSAADLEKHLLEAMGMLDDAASKLPQRHSDVWEVFKTVANKQDQEAMERFLADEAERHRFYERLTAYAKALQQALASVKFHEHTPIEQINRYRRDLKYFMQLRASVARRYGEKVDFKQYQASIQKLLDTYVGAGEVETLVDPVSILDKDAFAKEVENAGSPDAKAEMIANRVRRTIHERADEDPVFYKRFSDLIDKTIADMHAERISQLEALNKLKDIRDRVRDRRTFEDVPDILKTRDVAKSYYDIVQDQLADADQQGVKDGKGEYVTGGGVLGGLGKNDLAELAAKMDDIILAKRKVDWATDTDVQNQMRTAIEDAIFAFKAAHGVDIDFNTIDRLLDRVIDVARRRVP